MAKESTCSRVCKCVTQILVGSVLEHSIGMHTISRSCMLFMCDPLGEWILTNTHSTLTCHQRSLSCVRLLFYVP